jgi:hypothetical protein
MLYSCRTHVCGHQEDRVIVRYRDTFDARRPPSSQALPSDQVFHEKTSGHGSTWSGSAHVFTDPNTTRVRQQTARGGHGFSTLQQSWLTDFSWLRCEKDPDLMAPTAGRCSTESEDGVVCSAQVAPGAVASTA